MPGIDTVPFWSVDFTDRPEGAQMRPGQQDQGKIKPGEVIESLLQPLVWPVQDPPPPHPPPMTERLFFKSKGTYPIGEARL